MNNQGMSSKKVLKIILPIIAFIFIFIKSAQASFPDFPVSIVMSSLRGIISVLGFMLPGFVLALLVSLILSLGSYYLFIKKENRSKDKFKDMLVFVTVFIWLAVSIIQYY
jgi:hypothetical protein